MRILVTGASGAGTTTLGRALAAGMDCAFFDADDYYWMPTDPPFQDKRDYAGRLQSLLRDLGQSPAVIAGSIMNWGTELEESLSLVVFLTVPAAVRVARLKERELRRFGRVAPAFLEWAAQYDEGRLDGRSLQRHERWLAQRCCSVLRIDGDTSIQDRLARVRAQVSSLDWRAAVL
jgi:adenylate kinase family enzyme